MNMRRSSRWAGLAMAVLALAVWATQSSEAMPPPGGGGGGGGQKGSIVGEVIGASGGIGGATVMLFDGVSIDQVAETVTDANGNFSFNKVSAGEYTITAISFNPPCSGSTSVTVAPRKQVVVIVACD
jgi:hypothetical protein